MEKIYDTEQVISKLDSKPHSYFMDFLKTNTFEVGILRLDPNEKDTQSPHLADELYYVIEGNGYIRIDKKNHKVKKGSCIFVPAKTSHNFFGNNDRLVALYVFCQ
jgi:mannose-6-phosphate isomerase-like protein (cupin superfamily)